MDGLLLVHMPPGVPLVIRLIVEPIHTEDGPLMVPALAAGLTSMLKIVAAVPQLFVTE
jgi:hypothetical protein